MPISSPPPKVDQNCSDTRYPTITSQASHRRSGRRGSLLRPFRPARLSAAANRRPFESAAANFGRRGVVLRPRRGPRGAARYKQPTGLAAAGGSTARNAGSMR